VDEPRYVEAQSPGYDAAHVLAQIVELAPNGVALTTAAGFIMWANAELERMFGYTPLELLASSIERLVPERFRPGHTSLRDNNGRCQRSRALGAGHELFGVRADGTEFPIEVGISELKVADGVMVVETIVDISVRLNLEGMFRKMVEAAPCAMVVTDGRGRIVLVNPQCEAMFGYARTDLIGGTLEMLLPERLRVAHRLHREAFNAAPSIRQTGAGRDFTARRKDGTEFQVEIRLNPMPGEQGALTLASVTDITHRKTMELQAQHAHSSLEEFTYAASHELKAPLRGISHLVEWLAEDVAVRESPEAVRNVQRVNDRIQHLDQVIDDLLSYARAGAASADVVMVEPRALIDKILELQTMRPGFRICIHVEASPFAAAKTPLETVLRNIVGNALQHHDLDSGYVDVRVEDVDRYCVFTISDDGPGIPQTAQTQMFRMFQTLSSTPRAGSGIGLALSKRLVETHGGRIEVHSKDGTRGTSFRVLWPRFQWRQGHV
jgi:PAS domain S-box-containing protein